MRPITFSQVKPMDTTSFLGNGRAGKEEVPLPERIFLTSDKGKSVISPILLIIAAIVLFFMIKAR
ncbi:hypothetical protein J7L13_02700 [bacterium]|nr:hypothetical protein [bacterium]